jgi:DNA-binding NarL/FixJ family response regulator
MTGVRVLIADDQALIRSGLAMVVGSADGIEVIGEASDGAEAVMLAAQLDPDVVLMDVQMPRMDGIEATRRIAGSNPKTKVIILTTFDIDAYAFGGLDAGASGFLLKDSSSADILSAIRSVAAGDAVLAPRVTAELVRRYGSLSAPAAVVDPEATQRRVQRAQGLEQLGRLTERERDVFDALVTGMSNAEIAGALWLSESTVKTHVGRILQKLGLRDRVQAIIFASRSGVI